MACRRQAQGLAADSYAYYDNSTETVQECHWRGPERSASCYIAPAASASTHESWLQGAAGETEQMVGADHASARMADRGGNLQQIMFVNNMHVHVHVHQHAGELLISEEATQQAQAALAAVPASHADQPLLHFHANDPDFQHCTLSPQGLDFGHKVVCRRYKAQKHALSQYNMITYTQCPSTAQALSHAFTLYLSHKRSKHAIFLFDCDNLVDQLSSKWPAQIHFSEIESLIQQLGPDYEYHRRKIKSERYSLYFYVVKRIGVRFSEQGRRTWSGLFQWAHSLQQGFSGANAGSDLPGLQVIAQVVGIGLSLVGALG